MSVFPVFEGNYPRNVNKDATYHIKHSKDGPVVGIVFETQEGERWYPTSAEHPELVRMVNDVKVSHGGQPNGGFYINEYSQVIVPVISGPEYYLAGKYALPLRFSFEGNILSGEPYGATGEPLSPGDDWVGPHPGIPYIFGSRKGLHIRFTLNLRPGVEKDVRLGKVISTEAAKKTIDQICAIKGFAGGRFYVNEHRCMFTPIQKGYELRYVYLGQLDLSSWYPEPHAK